MESSSGDSLIEKWREKADSWKDNLELGNYRTLLLTCADELAAILPEIRREARLEEAANKDAAYKERDQLVCALSKLFPANLERHPDADTTWENDWRWIVFIDLPAGQATWHIHDSELQMFDHLNRFTGRVWDGHSSPEKYRRLAELQGPPVGATCQHCGRPIEMRNGKWRHTMYNGAYCTKPAQPGPPEPAKESATK